MNITEALTPVDISLSAFEIAVGNIRAQPNEVVLYCTQAAACVAYKIKENYNCKVVLIPNELAKSVFVWAVIGNDSMYYATPTS